MTKKELKAFIKKYKFYFIGAVAVVIILLAGLLDFQSSGTYVTLTNLPRGTQVILDEATYTTVGRDGLDVRIETSRGGHTIIATRPGYLPWAKEFVLKRGDNGNFEVFNLPTTPGKQRVDINSSEYVALFQKKNNYTLPTKDAPLQSEDGSVRIYVEGNNTIVAEPRGQIEGVFCVRENCTNRLVVASREEPVTFLSFLPGYNNVVVFTDIDNTFAIEITRVGVQNAQPIEHGGELVSYDGSLYAFNNNSFTRLILK